MQPLACADTHPQQRQGNWNIMIRRGKILTAGVAAVAIMLPGIASAGFVLDTGAPSGTGAPVLLYPAQSLAGEFAVTAGETITSLSAYLTAGTAVDGDTFTFEIISGSITSRNLSIAYSTTATFEGNGWTTAGANWTPTAGGDYWLALVQPTTGYQFDAPLETSAVTGTVPALGFAFKTSGSYSTNNAPAIGLEVTAVPLPASMWPMLGGLIALGGVAGRRRSKPAVAR